MRQMLLLSLLMLAGCQNIVGPFAAREPARIDDPRLPIFEQEAKGRDRWAIPDDSSKVGPRTGSGVKNR